MRFARTALALVAGTFLVGAAAAAELDFEGFAHFSAGYVKQADDATLFVNGVELPGAAFTTEGDVTFTFEGGIYVYGGFAVAASGTIPSSISNIASGVLTGVGNLGDETVGYYSLTGQYHFNRDGWFSPYVGAGVGYMHVVDTTDGAVSNLNIESAWGPVVQAGIDFKITEHLGVFVDVKKYWISTNASGTMAGNAITADARANPWVISSGIGIHF